MDIKYIFGLGNPGRKYQDTRHNIGFMVADLLAERHHIPFKNMSKLDCMIGDGRIGNERVRIAKPTTFMNNSGWAVSAVMDYFGAQPKDIIVLYDDIDIKLGMLRIRPKGSAGTHNGMRSVTEYLKTQDFMRVRLGIGRPRYDLIDHVLSPFRPEEREDVAEMVERGADAVECLITEGLQPAQEQYQLLKKNNDPKEDAK